MHTKLLFLAGVTAIVSSFHGFAKEEEAEKAALIASVESITVRSLQTAPEQIQVEARGMASTGGWTKPQLRKKGEKDGVYIFEFVAQRPTGIVTQALTKIEASTTFAKPADIREVQVVAKNNSKSEKVK
jgi:phenylpyruvate tautomerase PptA (4-oxalocrotonate tautomerase family)